MDGVGDQHDRRSRPGVPGAVWLVVVCGLIAAFGDLFGMYLGMFADAVGAGLGPDAPGPSAPETIAAKDGARWAVLSCAGSAAFLAATVIAVIAADVRTLTATSTGRVGIPAAVAALCAMTAVVGNGLAAGHFGSPSSLEVSGWPMWVQAGALGGVVVAALSTCAAAVRSRGRARQDHAISSSDVTS